MKLQMSSSGSLEIAQKNWVNQDKQLLGINSAIISEQVIKQPLFAQRSLIQLYDSIYFWLWNINNDGWWKYELKFRNFVYDDYFNLLSETRQKWNGSSWNDDFRYIYTYDGNNNKLSELIQTWDGEIWVNYELGIYTYDVNDNLTTILGQHWIDSSWVNSGLTSNTYDSANNCVSTLVQDWSDTIWGNVYLYSYTFDENQNKTTEFSCFWNDTIWENEWLFTYTYDAGNHLISELDQTWGDSIWWDFLLVTFNYDHSGNQVLHLEQVWGGSYWENSWQAIYTYDASNKMINELTQRWIGDWLNLSSTDNTYDSNSNLTRSFRQNWTNENTWGKFSEELYAYDDNDFMINKSSKHFGSNPTGIAYGDSTKYYFQILVGNKELPESLDKILIFPNPATTAIAISLPSTTPVDNTNLSIYNVNARQVISRRITEQQTVVDISTLPSGVYFTRVTNDRTVMVSKFIKR